jgi:GH35 family endo-1,4-beta-xylanase
MNQLAKEIAKNLITEDPEVEARIARDTDVNRKGVATLELTLPGGKELERAEVRYRQIRHEYRFGCNAFMLDEFKEAEKNAGYREIFADLFNLAVVPLYWSDLEPEDGKPRFDKNSPPVYRRPPVDLVLEFCEENHLVAKGHPLYWHAFVPDWVPNEQKALERRLEQRVAEIAARYGNRIPIWDVVNEAIQWNPLNHALMPEHHVETSFKVAEKYLPTSAELLINAGPWVSWDSNHGDYTPLYMLVRHLLGLGLPVKGVGLQYHMAFREPARMVEWAGQYCNARQMLGNLDQYAKLGLPLNVSEITITGHADLGDGDRFQELVIEKLYRLWFSHAATNGLIYWNLVDDTAFCWPGMENNTFNENKFRGGLLNNDLSPKPAFKVLKRLIKEEWNSSGTLDYQAGKPNGFSGFYGDYELEIRTDSGCFRKTMTHAKQAKHIHKIELKEA